MEIIKRCCNECKCETPEDVRRCPVVVYTKMLQENPTQTTLSAATVKNIWDGAPVSFLGIP